MTTEILFFVLRLVSAGLLLVFLAMVFFALWRDYRSTVVSIEAAKRAHGQLIAMREIDGQYIATGAAYPLLPLTSMGRAPTNTILVDDHFASNEHALLAMRNGQWWLEDRQSRNGTTLNDMVVRQPMVITDGDIIGIGNMRYRLELEK
ncbi:MAG: FHA domain-containing protein [Anaerolineae bacterium]|nr:FHA domain-containing protein [Anaerolineae bacterium]